MHSTIMVPTAGMFAGFIGEPIDVLTMDIPTPMEDILSNPMGDILLIPTGDILHPISGDFTNTIVGTPRADRIGHWCSIVMGRTPVG